MGTLDNDTSVGWWNTLADWQKETVTRLSNVGGSDISWELITRLAESRAELVIYSLQDIVGDGSESRMNIPGTLGCWKYMANRGDLSAENVKKLRALTLKTGRCGNN